MVKCKTASDAQCMLYMALCEAHGVVKGEKVDEAGDRPYLVEQELELCHSGSGVTRVKLEPGQQTNSTLIIINFLHNPDRHNLGRIKCNPGTARNCPGMVTPLHISVALRVAPTT